MITYKEVETTTITKELDKTFCDGCNKEQDTLNDDFFTLNHQFGYGSPKDGEILEANICEECLFLMLDEAKINYRTEAADMGCYVDISEDLSEYDGAI